MILSDDESLYEKLIDIKTFNREKDKSDVHKGFGLNFKITDLQSSLGLSQLSKLEKFIKLKKELHRQYLNNINDKYLKSFNEYETPWFIDLYCDSENQREELHLYLKQKNIETRFSYPSLSSQSYLQDIEKTDLTFSEEVSNNILWLPSSTNISREEAEYVSSAVNNFLEN